MRDRIYLLLLIILFLPLIGQSSENIFFQTNTGVTNPLNSPTLSNYYNKGVIMSSGIGYIINNQLALIGRVSYTYFRFREYYPSIIPFFIHEGYIWNSWSNFGGFKVEKTYLLEFSVNLKASQFKTNGILHPFISLGIGYLIQRIGNVEVTLMEFINSGGKHIFQLPGTGKSDNDFSLNFGAGIEARISKRFNFFVEGRLLMKRNLLTNYHSNNVYIPVEFGIRF